MEWTEEQKKNILQIYPSIEEYERIEERKQAEFYLASTDYVVIKMQEYALVGKEVDNDYKEILKKREECREVLRNSK